MRVLVTGSNGQLGSEIKDLASDYGNLNIFFKDLPELDICNFNELEKFVKTNKISSIINCAAYTAVDKAETENNIAHKVNAQGVQNLVKVMNDVNGKIIHISTDYVFNGDAFTPYNETNEVSPLGIYGKTKREGELEITESDVNGIVIRTSWLYSFYGNNFVKTMLRLGNEKEELGVIFDQIGTPTYARDLAKVCLDILSNNNLETLNCEGKIYHYSNEGVASWYDFAKAIMYLGDVQCKVNPIETKDYPTPAKRPHYSVLNKSKIKKDFNINIPYWRDSLEHCILRLNKK